MTLHARSVATSAGVQDAQFETVVEALIESGEIKEWKAKEIAGDLSRTVTMAERADCSSACGKVILLGEHAVVYGKPAIALPVPLSVEASVRKGGDRVRVIVSEWGLDRQVDPAATDGFDGAVNEMLESVDLRGVGMTLEVNPHLPRSMGLGGSAALAVAVVRDLSRECGLGLDDEAVNRLAFKWEKMAHGTPSGIDNTVSVVGKPIVFENDGKPVFRELYLSKPVPLVLGFTSRPSLTARAVAQVRAAWKADPAHIEALFDQIAQLTRSGVKAIEAARFDELGRHMNLCHGYLNALGVSTPELEQLIQIARDNGAIGAKLTGSGGGGSMIALCPGTQDQVAAAMEDAGFQSFKLAAAS